MTTWPSGTDLVVFDTIDSTMEEARRRTSAGQVGALWIAAKQQTAGRGRQGRHWQSKPGNLAATGLFHVRGTPADAAQLSFATSLAVADVLKALAPGIEVALKWPNDALLNQKKTAGILLENFGQNADGSLRLAIGIGLNLQHFPTAADANWPATSIMAETGSIPDFDASLVILADRMDRWITVALQDGFAKVRAAWLDRAINLGKEIRVRLPKETLTGLFTGLDGHGALMLEMPDEVRHISAGDVYFSEGA